MRLTVRSKKQYIWGAAVVMLMLSVFVVVWASSDNQGRVISLPTKKPVYAPAYKDLNGTYVSFQYKGNYGVHKLDARDADLEQYMLTADVNYDKRLTVSISKLGEGLNSNPAYLLRQSQPELYVKSQLDVAGGSAVAWTKTTDQEETVIIPHGDKVAVLSFTTTGRLDSLDQEVTTLLKTFRWKS